MRKVSIRTAQNVSIDFNIAPPGTRAAAFAIDLVVMGAATMVLSFFLLWMSTYMWYLLLSVFVFYTLVSELLMNGQTIGKRAMRIRVVGVNGGEPSPMDFAIRWALRLVDIWSSLGGVALVLTTTSARGQRLGDILGNSMVVSLTSEMQLSLSDILRIDDRGTYVPTYTEAYRFSEEEMLTVKTLLERAGKYPHPTYRRLLDQTARRCADVLHLPQPPENRKAFLQTLIRDYIVITRS
jgi:uncharacterized RDD family membrane protein YckC